MRTMYFIPLRNGENNGMILVVKIDSRVRITAHKQSIPDQRRLARCKRGTTRSFRECNET